MSTTAKAAPPGAASPLSPEEAIDALTTQMGVIAKRLVAKNEHLHRENLKVHTRLLEAQNEIESLQNQLRTKDEVISELQALVARKP